MKKSISIISMSLLAASLTIPIGRASAANPPGNHKQREELRRDMAEFQELRRQRNRELREGDRREARIYNEKIREQRREIRDDRRAIYGQNDPRWHREYDGRWHRDSWRHDHD